VGDRGSIPTIPGAMTGFLNTGMQVAYFAAANEFTRLSLFVSDPPSGGTVTAELNTASDGSGDSISVTIADGDNFATATGSVTLAAGSSLYLIITEDSGGALNLSGEYEVSQSSGVTTLLTTLAKVKLDGNISGTDADRDTVLNSIIAGISKRMQNYIDRNIVQATATNETVDSDGYWSVQTRHWPIISITSVTLADGTVLVENTDFECLEADKANGWIVRLSGGYTTGWERGQRVAKVTYVHGFAAVPDDLVQLATYAVLWEFNQTQQSGKGWRGLLSKGVDPASAVTFDRDFWEREVVPALLPYRRLVA